MSNNSYTLKVLSNIPYSCKKLEKQIKPKIKNPLLYNFSFNLWPSGGRVTLGDLIEKNIDSRVRFYKSPSPHDPWERVVSMCLFL